MKNHPLKFKKPLDELWAKADDDNNGFLDKNEAPRFLEEVVENIESEHQNNYDPSKFDEMFEKFDEDKNGYLSKGEMAVFIK